MRSIDDLPPAVTVYEVGPRDGLQNEPHSVCADVKVEFIDLLSSAGLPFIEVTSFVRVGAIPQLSDAEEVAARFERFPKTIYTALVPNTRGMERAADAHLGGIALFTAASETFSRHNTNASIGETLDRFRPVMQQAVTDDLWVRAYVSTAFGCPFEGSVSTQAVVEVTRELIKMGVSQVSISDTIGVATPRDVIRVLRATRSVVPLEQTALHFHDTRGTALANVFAGLQMDVTVYDSSAGGLGGCPYAPGASGNLATEDLVFMLNGLGIESGVSLEGVVAASRRLSLATGRSPASRYYHAATA